MVIDGFTGKTMQRWNFLRYDCSRIKFANLDLVCISGLRLALRPAKLRTTELFELWIANFSGERPASSGGFVCNKQPATSKRASKIFYIETFLAPTNVVYTPTCGVKEHDPPACGVRLLLFNGFELILFGFSMVFNGFPWIYSQKMQSGKFPRYEWVLVPN